MICGKQNDVDYRVNGDLDEKYQVSWHPSDTLASGAIGKDSFRLSIFGRRMGFHYYHLGGG